MTLRCTVVLALLCTAGIFKFIQCSLLAPVLSALPVEKVERAEADGQKSAVSESPFLKGIEELVTHDTFVDLMLVVAQQFSTGPAGSCATVLLSLRKKLDACASKLAERDSAEHQRKVQIQASIAKISTLECSVQKLADVMTKFRDDKLLTIC